MLQTIVQIIVRCEDDAAYDSWYDICLNLVPENDTIHNVIKMFDKVGCRLDKHVLVWPKETCDDILSKEELQEMCDFDPSEYNMYEPKPDKICIIKGRYVMKMD